MGVSYCHIKIDEIHLKIANAKQTNAFDFARKINLESEAYLEPSRLSAMELFRKKNLRVD